MPTDRDRLLEVAAGALRNLIRHQCAYPNPGDWCDYCRGADDPQIEEARVVITALAQAAQDAPLVIQSDGSVGRLEQVGWMPSAALMQEHGVRPTDDDYLTSLESAESEGGIREQFADRMLPVYRIREEAPDA